jgi:uncharacterized membrane protein
MNRELSNKINLLLRSEKAMLKLEMRRRSRQVVLVAIGVIAAFATLVMLNVTAYLYLVESYTPLYAAMALTGIDMLVAILFFIVAMKQSLGSEAEAVNEIREYARKELRGEFESLEEKTVEIRESFAKLSSGFSVIKAVVPLVKMFVKRNEK